MTEGQESALRQLRAIEQAAPERFEVLRYCLSNSILVIEVSLYCGDIEKVTSGLPLRMRERFIIYIRPSFPFHVPAVEVPHSRFAGFPHVQWRRHLCLYQSTSTEWNPKDGMYGFVERLDWWLRQGALDQLDPIGAPIHPPVAYWKADAPVVVVNSDSPKFDGERWLGFASLSIRSESRMDVISWHSVMPSGYVAAVVLLNKPMPFEFPVKLSDLLLELENRDVLRQELFQLLQMVSLCEKENTSPLYIIIGTAMRGTSGSLDLKQHLVAWRIPTWVSEGVVLSIAQYSPQPEVKIIGEEVEQILWKWAETAEIEWCRIMENRPEIVLRRDKDTPMTWFSNRTVILWGCGALGGHVALWLARAGIKKLVLCDNGTVAPGILVRQPFEEGDIGKLKVEALSHHLRDVRPDIEVVTVAGDILDGGGLEQLPEADLLLDTTGNRALSLKLECVRKQMTATVPMAVMFLGHEADRGFCALAAPGYSGGPYDIIRKTKLACCKKEDARHFLEEFWPENRHTIFQPEPGCSDPTFIGSAVDICGLAANMFNLLASDLKRNEQGSAYSHLIASPTASADNGIQRNVDFTWDADILTIDPGKGLEIRIAPSAWNEMISWSRKICREQDEWTETGGVLFGELDEVSKVIWISDLIGPPPDSNSSQDGFLCGTEGVKEYAQLIEKQTRGSVRYVGMWHTHPNGEPVPSPVDYRGMKNLVEKYAIGDSKTVMLLLANPLTEPSLGAFVYSKDDFANTGLSRKFRLCIISRPSLRNRQRRIGLALSGGGSRAIAFHLGCLRALHDYGLLDDVDVISAVSGGSVIAAMYAYVQDDYPDFEKRVIKVLQQGFMRETIFRYILWPPRFLLGCPIFLINIIAAGAASCGKWILNVAGRLLRRNKPFPDFRFLQPLPRPITRTHAFIETLKSRLWGDITVTSATRNGIGIVLNACELRTGSAFRFGNRESGCWRFGKVEQDVTVAEAVAASAAYPVFLPAVDRTFLFKNRIGGSEKQRVLLTDGGVYDNLGVTCMLPGKSSDISYNAFTPDYIICCAAGPGLMSADSIPTWWVPRMIRSFLAVHRKTQDSAFSMLHELAQSGRIKGFLLPYLGQTEGSLPYIPPRFIKRQEVVDYPTNFSAMATADIKRIASRGEQLTRLLIKTYQFDD